MSIERRLGKLEDKSAPEDPPTTFRLCEAPGGMTDEEHDGYHRRRAEGCFTLKIGDCEVAHDNE